MTDALIMTEIKTELFGQSNGNGKGLIDLDGNSRV